MAAAAPVPDGGNLGADAPWGGVSSPNWDRLDSLAAAPQQAAATPPLPPRGVPQGAREARAAPPLPPTRLCCVPSCRLPLPVLAGGRGRTSAVVKFERRYGACRSHMEDVEVDVGDGPQRYCQARRQFLTTAETWQLPCWATPRARPSHAPCARAAMRHAGAAEQLHGACAWAFAAGRPAGTVACRVLLLGFAG